MMRAGLYRPVHVKTLRSQKLRMLLKPIRKLLQSKAIAIDNDLRGTLRNFGLKVGVVGASKFRGARPGARREPAGSRRAGRTVADRPADAARADRHSSWSPAGDRAHRRCVPAPDDGAWCRSCGGADLSRHRRHVPARFRNSQGRRGGVRSDTCWQVPNRAGDRPKSGGISRCGDEMMRAMLYEAAHIMLVRVPAKWSVAQGVGHEDRQAPAG